MIPAHEYVFTEHATTVLARREIDARWVMWTLNNPERSELDKYQQGVRHALARISERRGRWLRVVYNRGSRPMRIITVYLDRRLWRHP